MLEQHTLFTVFVTGWLLLGTAVFVLLFFVTAPYGRHVRGGWGPTLPSRSGWFVMEAPAALVFAGGFVVGAHHDSVAARVFLVMWEAHYVYRAFVYPFTLRDDGGRMPFSVVGMAVVFNSVNASLNSLWLFDISGGYPGSWLSDPRFLAGLALFLAGMTVNRRADGALRRLRAAGGQGY